MHTSQDSEIIKLSHYTQNAQITAWNTVSPIKELVIIILYRVMAWLKENGMAWLKENGYRMVTGWKGINRGIVKDKLIVYCRECQITGVYSKLCRKQETNEVFVFVFAFNLGPRLNQGCTL